MWPVTTRDVFVTGGTGYMGQRLVPALLARGHRVRVLTRPSSIGRVPAGASVVVGDAVDADSFRETIGPRDTLVHLVGTRHPSPAKAREFVRVDLPSILASVGAAQSSGAAHIVFVSVAHPAPVRRPTSTRDPPARRQSSRRGLPRRFCGRGTCSGRAIGGPWPSCPSMRSRSGCPRHATAPGA